MKAKVPNYLYPLATERQIQWTKDTVKGEKFASTPFKPKKENAAKKEIIKNLVKGKIAPIRRVTTKTRGIINPLLKLKLPEDPMKAPDPSPGNVMHVSPVLKGNYYGYQG